MKTIAETSINRDATKIRGEFRDLLARANKENARPSEVKALSDFLYENKGLELWKSVLGMGAFAERMALDSFKSQGTRKCWELRLESIRADLGFESASALERLLIQQVTLCWLNLNVTECRHSAITGQSVMLPVALYWEHRLTAAQRRFTRACESLARVRRLSRRIPVQVNIATQGGQQVNVSSPP